MKGVRWLPADAQILSEIREHSEAMENLEYLSDNIGPRLTGSPQLKQANEWTRDMFEEIWADERAPGAVDDRAFLDARNGAARAIVSPSGASVDDCGGGMVAEHAGSGARDRWCTSMRRRRRNLRSFTES